MNITSALRPISVHDFLSPKLPLRNNMDEGRSLSTYLLKEKQYLLVPGDMHDSSGSIGMDDDSARIYGVGFTTDGGIGITFKRFTIFVCNWHRVLDHIAALLNSKRYTDVTV